MELGRLIFYCGIFLVIGGAVLIRFPGMFNWFGTLPGDLKFQNGKVSLYIPLTSMVIVSVIVSAGPAVIGKILSK